MAGFTVGVLTEVAATGVFLFNRRFCPISRFSLISGFKASNSSTVKLYFLAIPYLVSFGSTKWYFAEATGVLINEDEVLPKDLKEKLSLENFKDRGNKTVADTLTKTIVYNPKERKIWKFSATNVHDFAFISGPTYRFAEVNCDGVLIKSMVQEKNAKGWLTTNDFMCKVLQVYNKDYKKCKLKYYYLQYTETFNFCSHISMSLISYNYLIH